MYLGLANTTVYQDPDVHDPGGDRYDRRSFVAVAALSAYMA